MMATHVQQMMYMTLPVTVQVHSRIQMVMGFVMQMMFALAMMILKMPMVMEFQMVVIPTIVHL